MICLKMIILDSALSKMWDYSNQDKLSYAIVIIIVKTSVICNQKASSHLFYIYIIGQKDDYVHCSYLRDPNQWSCFHKQSIKTKAWLTMHWLFKILLLSDIITYTHISHTNLMTLTMVNWVKNVILIVFESKRTDFFEYPDGPTFFPHSHKYLVWSLPYTQHNFILTFTKIKNSKVLSNNINIF